MKILLLIPVIIAFLIMPMKSVFSQDPFETTRKEWLKKAEEAKPELHQTIKQPLRVVHLTEDASSFQGWKTYGNGNIDELYSSSFKEMKETVVDFGEHLTGHFSFQVKALNGTPDAPLRFKFTFGEVPSEIAVPFEPFTGTLSRAWLQDEIITVTQIPSTITIPRRLAFRYVKIELLASSPYYDFCINSMECATTTSAVNAVEPLLPTTNNEVAAIDKIGLNTLKECMQTVYEDGPKRDQRLWIGDLYLESLANTYSYRNHNLTKRSLYLLAALSAENGFLHANVFETPEPHAQAGTHILDYALLYNVALLEYAKATGDLPTAADLWPIAKRQVEIAKEYISEEGIFDVEKAKNLWLFFDWKDSLDKQAPMQGLMIFAFNNTIELAKMVGKSDEVKDLSDLVQKMKKAARKQMFDKSLGLIVSGPNKQVSLASQIWMIMGGVLMKEEAKFTISKAASMENSVKPGSPYLYHYYVEALIKCGMAKEARKIIVTYWGGMMKKGADTFWEVYDPTNEKVSPYNFYPINSYCHAWSCTPVYFIRKYPAIFQ